MGKYDLLPCPFCGEDVYLDRVPLWKSYNGSTHGYYGCYEFDVHCRNTECGCRVPLIKNDTVYRDEEEARLNAIAQWNRRA